MRISDWSSDVCSSDLLARQAIDDAGLAAVRFEEVAQLRAAVVLLHHGIADVGAVEGAGEAVRVLQLQAFGDLALGRRVGGRGERDPRDVGPALVQQGQLAVLARSEEHTSELQSLMRISYAVFSLKKKKEARQPNK